VRKQSIIVGLLKMNLVDYDTVPRPYTHSSRVLFEEHNLQTGKSWPIPISENDEVEHEEE